MITAKIEIALDDDWDDGLPRRCRIVTQEVPAITGETCRDLINYAHTQMKDGEALYQICAKRPHVKNESLPQPFYDYFNGPMIEWWNS